MEQIASRRTVLRTASAAVLAQAMTGAIPAAAAPVAAHRPRRRPRNGQRVAILGAGLSGLAAALELRDAGYDVRILEALPRPGGRSLTVRGGDEVTEVWDDGRPRTQRCRLEEGIYLNLGPGRIPHHHRRVLHLCRRLGVALEPYILENSATCYHTPRAFDGRSVAQRRITHDTRGRIAELAAERVREGGRHSDGLDRGQRREMLDLLRAFGDLDEVTSRYEGSTRAGLSKPLSVHQMHEPAAPLSLGELVEGQHWHNRFYWPLGYDRQGPLFQPVGGMDMIIKRLVGALGDGVISYSAPVTGVRLLDGAVHLAWSEDGRPRSGRFDHCLSSIPLPRLAALELEGFSRPYVEAVRHCRYAPACKLGWQANSRFWEADTYDIYGGISWLDHEIMQIWYPSHGYFSDKGALIGAYNYGKRAARFGDRSHAERLRCAREAGARIHPEFHDRRVMPEERGMSVAWHKVPHQAGGWAEWRAEDEEDKQAYGALLYPEGRFHAIGCQLSPLPSWQEGALMSVEWVVEVLTHPKRHRVRRLVRRAPDSWRLTHTPD
ncbi:FAD-dependent oxidoreductase [Streptomyces sp. ODS28]|uniref:flavin monoamine oxidase family protein n=1 Tax=Streptomyces sp. ODS28 TaxID=3136688 RepID=UPI0031ED6952